MNILSRQSLRLLNSPIARWVSNVSPKRFNYTFETGSVRKIHPTRQLSDGTDRILISPNLLAITDHGSGVHDNKFSANLDDTYAVKLLKVLNSFFYHQMEKYIENPFQLVNSAINSIKLEGSCTLTLAMLHPQTGQLIFYYIGDSLYAIFKQKQVVIVEPLYYGFNEPFQLGTENETVESGYVERYPYSQVKDEVILVASNGLWNNVDLELLHYEIRGPHSFNTREKQEPNSKRPQYSDPKSLQQISERIGSMGAYYSRKGNFESPFFKLAKRYGAQVPKQGYLDDIAVIMAKVKADVVIK